MQPSAAVPTRRDIFIRDHTDAISSSAPTKDQILVPETLLKKRKSQEKAREQRNSAIEKRKTVRYNPSVPLLHSVMISTNHATRLRSMLSLR
jgi:hypothetical protein